MINNAGIGQSSIRPDAEVRHPGIAELTPEIYDRFFGVFVRAPATLVRAALPMMQAAGFGRIVNNTTSYLTMLRVLPYGAAKAAFEVDVGGMGVGAEGRPCHLNVLVPGGPTDTPLIADESGWDRTKMLRPEIMGPPIAWLLSDASASFNGQRITAARWDAKLPRRGGGEEGEPRHRLAGARLRRGVAGGLAPPSFRGTRASA